MHSILDSRHLLSISLAIPSTYQRSCNGESINYSYFQLFTSARRGQRKQLHCAKFSLSCSNLHLATERSLLRAEWTANAYPIRNIRLKCFRVIFSYGYKFENRKFITKRFRDYNLFFFLENTFCAILNVLTLLREYWLRAE